MILKNLAYDLPDNVVIRIRNYNLKHIAKLFIWLLCINTYITQEPGYVCELILMHAYSKRIKTFSLQINLVETVQSA